MLNKTDVTHDDHGGDFRHHWCELDSTEISRIGEQVFEKELDPTIESLAIARRVDRVLDSHVSEARVRGSRVDDVILEDVVGSEDFRREGGDQLARLGGRDRTLEEDLPAAHDRLGLGDTGGVGRRGHGRNRLPFDDGFRNRRLGDGRGCLSGGRRVGCLGDRWKRSQLE
jgi:hypothetical protein